MKVNLHRRDAKLVQHRLKLIETDSSGGTGVVLFKQRLQSCAVHIVVTAEFEVWNDHFLITTINSKN